MTVVTVQPSQLWGSVLELTKSAQLNNTDPLLWALQLNSTLSSAGVALPSPDLAHLLVSHICFANHVPITWKLLEKAIALKFAPPLLVLALLSNRVVPNRNSQPAAYRLYMELLKRHAFTLLPHIKSPNYHKILKSVDEVLNLSRVFELESDEPGLVLVEFLFSVVWQLLDAALEDDRLLEKKSIWLSRADDMEVDGFDSFSERKNEKQLDGLRKMNTVMAVELIGEFLQNKVTSRILHLAQQNLPSYWGDFIHHLQLLVARSTALRSSKSINPETLLQLVSSIQRLLSRPLELQTVKRQEFNPILSYVSLILSVDQCHGASRSALWLPIDLFLEDAMDGTQVLASSSIETLTGLVKSLQAVNATTWHDTFLGLWIAALRLVQRERDPTDGPIPRLDSCLSMLFSITTLAVANIIEEEESELKEVEWSPTNQKMDGQGPGNCRKGLITCLQHLGDYEGLLTPPPTISSAANHAAAKALMFISGGNASNGYFENMNDMAINCSGNMWHLIVEACIARNLLDTSAYLWQGYVNPRPNQVPRARPNQVPRGGPAQPSAWSSLMKGAPLTPSLVKSLVATPASSLPEIEKLYEIAVNGSDDEKISAATILCGASLVRGWNIQEHTILFIIQLLSPPSDYSGSENHLINCAPLLYVLLDGVSSVDCTQILSLHGLVPLLASVLMPICEVFGSTLPKVSWSLPTGEEISCLAVFSIAFTLLLRLWRFDHPPLEQVMGDIPPVGSIMSPEFLLLVRNSQMASFGTLPRDRLKRKRYSKSLKFSTEPVFMDSFPKLKLWYRQHLECISCAFSGLVSGTLVHQIVDALLTMMFKRINRSSHSLSSTTSGSSNSSGAAVEDAYSRLKVPAWDILEATPFVLDAALTACAHGRLSPRELATGLKDLADFLPATLATIVSYFSAEVTRGIWKPAFMNGTDWPSPAANLSSVEQQIKKLLVATGVDVPSLTVGGSSPVTLPLPLAALVSLTITYRLDKSCERSLTLIGPALNALAAGCPWPCMPIVASLWSQKVKRWSDYFVFSASRTAFHHSSDAVVQLLKSCFTSVVGLDPLHITSNGGVGPLLGHGVGSHFSGGISPVAPGFFYLRVHRSVRDVMFMTEEILSILMQSVRDIATSSIPRETREKLKKTKHGMRYGQVSLAAAMTRIKLAATLGASLVWISGGLALVQALIKETLPSWFISAHGSDREGGENGGMITMLRGYALSHFAVLCGTFAWGVDSESPASKRRQNVVGAHLEFLASALEGKITLGCDGATARAYVTGFLSLMATCAPKWVLEVDVDVLKRLSRGLMRWNDDELAFTLLGFGGVGAMGAAAELIVETGS